MKKHKGQDRLLYVYIIQHHTIKHTFMSDCVLYNIARFS